MSIHIKGSQLEWLTDYREGRIPMGLGINAPALDNHWRYKPKELTMILGHDNVGKTYFITFYILCIAIIHNKKICIWSGENGHAQIYRDMIQMLSGKHFMDLTHKEIRFYSNYLDQYFDFVDNSKLYTPDALLDIFDKAQPDACFIDPYTGLDRDFQYGDNYNFLNKSRVWMNSTGISMYIITHPGTPAGRTFYREGHIWAGHLKAPNKNDVEGGKPFVNRIDNAMIVHRLADHVDMKYYTMIEVHKMRDTQTGGGITLKDSPILAEFNNGLGFKIGGVEPLKKIRESITKDQTKLW